MSNQYKHKIIPFFWHGNFILKLPHTNDEIVLLVFLSLKISWIFLIFLSQFMLFAFDSKINLIAVTSHMLQCPTDLGIQGGLRWDIGMPCGRRRNKQIMCTILKKSLVDRRSCPLLLFFPWRPSAIFGRDSPAWAVPQNPKHFDRFQP